MKKLEYVCNYYKVPAEIGRDVTVSGRLGTITEDMGNYIGVTFHDDKNKNSVPCHPTSEVIYLETFTPLSKFKISRSAQNYRNYLNADVCETFAEWMGFASKSNRYY